MISQILVAALLGLAVQASAGPREGGFLKAQGTLMVDQAGKEVRLRGFGLGNWYLPEGYMWKFGGGGDRPRKIEAVVEKVLGPAEAKAFWKAFRDGYINENDIRRIAELGYNSVRPALKSRDFMTEPGGAWVQEGFDRLDQLIGWARKHNLYVIIDLHAAPGGQTGKNIDDSPRDLPELFTTPAFQDQTEKLWVALAKKYKDEPVVAAYDLLNEPLPDDFKQHKPKLEPLYKRLTQAIRKVDQRHMIILEGANWANDWSVFGPPFDPNLVYQFHKYWNEPDKASVQGYLDFQARYQVPVWIGEFGESKVGSHWYWASSQLFDDMGWGWAFWPWKKLDTESSPYSIKMPQGWDKIQAVADGKPAPPREEGRRIMAEFLRNIRMENCTYVPEVSAYLLHQLPAKVEAENYGHLGEGRSYHSVNPSHKARSYRRGEAMDVRSLGGDQGHNVGWTEAGEWLDYDLQVERAGAYDFAFRVAADSGGKSFRLEQDGRDLSGEIAVPATGSWSKWAVFQRKGVPLAKGPLKLRIHFTTGGVNLDHVSASLAGQPLPARPENAKMRRGKPGVLPGRFEAEDFGLLGEGKSYHDVDASNNGGSLRQSEAVDIQAVEEDAGHFVALKAGEWLSYEVNLLGARTLKAQAKAVAEKGGVLDLILDGKVLGSVKVGAAWSEVALGSHALPAGKHAVGLRARQGSVSVDSFEFRP